MTREEKIALLDELLKIEERNDIGNLTSKERAEFQEWVRVDATIETIKREIEELEEGISSYYNDRPWVYKDEVIAIIEKYTGGTEYGTNSN